MPKKTSLTVIFISVFGRFSVDRRRKRIKKCELSNEKELLWTGEMNYITILPRFR